MDAKEIARTGFNHFSNCVGDMSYDLVQQFEDGMLWDDKMSKKLKKAKKDGVYDLGGWLADELFNEPGWFSDLTGDRVFELCQQHKVKKSDVWTAMEDIVHRSLKAKCIEKAKYYKDNPASDIPN